MSSPIYTHRLTGRNIRLLELLPGAPTDTIKCRLVTVHLDQRPDYEALSYVWGPPVFSVEISCNDHPYYITRSLNLALRRLRLPDASRTIWADAACINQNDIEERSMQVALMRDIYSLARRVVVWLGQEPLFGPRKGMTPRVQTTLSRIENACRSFAESSNQDLKSLCCQSDGYPSRALGDVEVDLDVIKADLERTQQYWRDFQGAVSGFFSSTWFTRTWCIQEVVLAQRAILLYGQSAEFQWEQVGITAAWLLAAGRNDKLLWPYMPVEKAYRMFTSTTYTGKELLYALDDFAQFKATDPRDKAYGMLGLLSWERDVPPLPIDYGGSLRDVFITVAKTVLDARRDLELLSAVETTIIYPDLPSWVPSWSARSTDTRPVYHTAANLGRESLRNLMAWNACGDRVLDGVNISPSGAIALRGFRLAQANHASSPHSRKQDGREVTEGFFGSPTIDILHRCFLDPDPKRAIMDFAFTLTWGRTVTGKPIEDASQSEQENHHALFSRALGVQLESICPSGHVYLDNDKSGLSGADFMYAMGTNSIFDTNNGLYGIGPATMREGDVIAVLLGGRVPYVLRPLKEGFMFLGTCYIRQIMHGEALINREGEVLEDEGFVIY